MFNEYIRGYTNVTSGYRQPGCARIEATYLCAEVPKKERDHSEIAQKSHVSKKQKPCRAAFKSGVPDVFDFDTQREEVVIQHYDFLSSRIISLFRRD
jgi:hypothetical protein